MVTGVQGQWHEQLVAICAGEGNSPGEAWFVEPRRTQKGFGEGNRIIFLYQIISRLYSIDWALLLYLVGDLETLMSSSWRERLFI